jgi:ribonuclease HI
MGRPRPTRKKPKHPYAHAWTDGSNGSSKGDCGAAAYVIADARTHEVIEEHAEKFPNVNGNRFTNNDMEMAAIYLCLQAGLKLGVEDLVIHSDSEWAVKIILGEYRLSMEKFRSLLNQIHALGEEYASISIRHVRREMNQRADHLCTVATNQNRALKRAPGLVWTAPRPQVR